MEPRALRVLVLSHIPSLLSLIFTDEDPEAHLNHIINRFPNLGVISSILSWLDPQAPPCFNFFFLLIHDMARDIIDES